MHHGHLSTSERLQRVHRFLANADDEVSTLEIVVGASVMAVSAAISELRENGAVITCRQEMRRSGRVWLYRMIQPAPEASDD